MDLFCVLYVLFKQCNSGISRKVSTHKGSIEEVTNVLKVSRWVQSLVVSHNGYTSLSLEMVLCNIGYIEFVWFLIIYSLTLTNPLNNMNKLTILFVALSLSFASCYNASVITDKAPSNVVIDKPWALSFVYGLIPPATIDASETCTNGIAKVETKISFLNQLVNGLTAGLVTPMHITVTCAVADRGSLEMNNQNLFTVSKGSDIQEIQEIFMNAADQAVNSYNDTYVMFK